MLLDSDGIEPLELEKFKSRLLARARASLLNPLEITDEAVHNASVEALKHASTRACPLWALNDFAMMRLKNFLKVAWSAEDEASYRIALREIERAPACKDCTGANLFYGAI